MDFNASNWTADWMSLWTQPYTHVFGDMFFTLLLVIIVAGLYIGSDRNTFLVAIFCFVMAVIFGPIFNFYVSAFVLLITGLVFSMITYSSVVEKRPR
jgi:FtsH-binding integral membrane protein